VPTARIGPAAGQGLQGSRPARGPSVRSAAATGAAAGRAALGGQRPLTA